VNKGRGFTLIEVAVALAIIAWVWGSAIAVVSQYADERRHLQDKFLATQVSWNQLMDQYLKARQWLPPERRGLNEDSGRENQGGRDWYWHLETRAAAGENLFRYRISTGPQSNRTDTASLILYQVVTE